MSSSQEFTVYKTLPYNIYARAAGKWDYLLENQFYNSSQTVNINMTNYDGLSMTVEEQYLAALSLNFSSTVLPWKWDYYNYLLTSKYVFMPTGQYYEGVPVKSPNTTDWTFQNITFTDRTIASGFSNDNLIYCKNMFSPSSSDTWEFQIKGLYSATNQQRPFGTSENYHGFDFWINSSRQPNLKISSNGSSWDIYDATNTNFTFVVNTIYWFKMQFTGTNYIFSVSTDNWTTSTELFNIESSAGVYSYTPRIGKSATGTGSTYQWRGNIYLEDSFIKLNEQYWTKLAEYVGDMASFSGITYNYNDDGSAVTLNAFVVNNDESIVLTPNNSYTNGYYLGTVNIPLHDVYNYAETTTAWTQPTLSSAGTIGGSSFACYASSRYLYNYDYYAFDGNNSTAWISHSSATPANNYLEFYNPDAIRISQITIKNSNNYYIGDYEFQYSDDGNLWSVATSGTNTNKTSGGEWSFNVNVGSHKYWRIVANQNGMVAIVNLAITANTVTGTWTKQTAVPWTQPALSANGTMGGSTCACAMDSTWDSRRIAYKAFDGNTILSDYETDTAHSNNGYPHWIAFYSPDDIKVTSVTIYNGNEALVPADYEFQCSDDYSTWTTIASGTNTVGTDGMQGGQWSFNIPTANQGYHKYYRFYATSALQGSGYWNQFMALTEIQLTALVEASS